MTFLKNLKEIDLGFDDINLNKDYEKIEKECSEFEIKNQEGIYNGLLKTNI
jgi:hypothetical protein